jgi:FtsX-like permease family
MGAVGYRFRAELRGRWLAWLALAALVGIVAGAVFVLSAGARRTGSAHERFLSEQRAYDVATAVACEDREATTVEAPPDMRCLKDAARLPALAATSVLSTFPAFVETGSGQSLQPDGSDPCYSGPGMVGVVADPSGRFGTAINTYRYVQGGPADPRAADEVVLSQGTAQRFDVGVGSVLRLRLFDGADCLDRRSTWRSPVTVRVVGVQLSPGEVQPPSGFYLQSVSVTPAFVASAGAVQDRDDFVVGRLQPGETSRSLLAQARAAGIAMEIVVDQGEGAEAVDRAIRPITVSLAVLAALTALAGVAVIGQVLVRQSALESRDRPVLAALGFSRKSWVVLSVARGAFVGVAAALVAAGVAVAASPLMPVGLSRRVEPNGGLDIDPAVIGIGTLFTIIFVVAVCAVSAWHFDRVLTRPTMRDAPRRPAVLANAAARAGLAPATVSGVRLALERGSGARAVPVASSFAGLTIAVAAIVGALTFGTSLNHLIDTPRLVGWNWDVVVGYPEIDSPNGDTDSAGRERIDKALETDPAVVDYAHGTFWPPFPQGRPLQLGRNGVPVSGFMTFDGGARVGPSVIDGRKPSAADEILLGPETLEELDLRIGDRVDVTGQAGTWEDPGEETSTRVKIVGTGAVPTADRLGRGAVMTLEGLARLNEVGAGGVFVRLAPGARPASVLAAMRKTFPDTPPDSIGLLSSGPFAELLLDVQRIDLVPLLFAGLMGIMAVAVLAHVLVTATQLRRRDHAILRTLGFSRRQTMRAVASQAIVYALGALIIGVPTGIVLGRLAWRAYSDRLGVVPEPVTSPLVLVLVAVAVLGVALLASVTPAWRIARQRPAVALRTE